MIHITSEQLIDNVIEFLNNHLEEGKRIGKFATKRGAKWVLSIGPDGNAGFSIDSPVWDKIHNEQAVCFIEAMQAIALWALYVLDRDKDTKRTVVEINPRLKPTRHLSDLADCVTCGQEYDTYLRSNGKYYCSRCWQAWNS